MIEDEAKKRWCPFVQLVISSNGASYNNRLKNDTDDAFMCCIAPKCMAWRSTIMSGVNGKTGYCGLMGKS